MKTSTSANLPDWANSVRKEDAEPTPRGRSLPAEAPGDKIIECTECRSGLLYLTPKRGLQLILAILLLRPRKTWRCHACGRTVAVS